MRISDWSSDVCSSDLVRRACIPLSGALLIVAGNPGARGHADLLRRGCLLDMHAGRSHRTANPVEHEGDTEKQAKEDQRRQHRVTLSHAPTSKIGRAHVCTPVTNAHLVCRLLLDKKKNTTHNNH